jgi:hypothetical protein
MFIDERQPERDLEAAATHRLRTRAVATGQRIWSLARRGKRGNIPGRAFRTAMPEQETAIVENRKTD